jgi:hypothetical protein
MAIYLMGKRSMNIQLSVTRGHDYCRTDWSTIYNTQDGRMRMDNYDTHSGREYMMVN